MTQNDVMCLGWAYGYLSNFREISPQEVGLASMRPFYGFSSLVQKMRADRKITNEMDDILAEILSGVTEIPDKHPEPVISSELQGVWHLAYYRGKSGTPLKFDIAERRKQRGLTQSELADQIGATQAMISRWENGVAEPTPGYVESLRQILG